MQQERRNHVRVLEQLIGKPYKANGYGPDGYDCYGMIHDYLTRIGAKTISCWGDVTIDNYTDYYQADRQAANVLLMEVFEQLGEAVDINDRIAGDLVIMENTKTKDLYPGIYAGNGNVALALIDRGVMVVPANKRLFRLIRVRRPI